MTECVNGKCVSVNGRMLVLTGNCIIINGCPCSCQWGTVLALAGERRGLRLLQYVKNKISCTERICKKSVRNLTHHVLLILERFNIDPPEEDCVSCSTVDTSVIPTVTFSSSDEQIDSGCFESGLTDAARSIIK